MKFQLYIYDVVCTSEERQVITKIEYVVFIIYEHRINLCARHVLNVSSFSSAGDFCIGEERRTMPNNFQ